MAVVGWGGYEGESLERVACFGLMHAPICAAASSPSKPSPANAAGCSEQRWLIPAAPQGLGGFQGHPPLAPKPKPTEIKETSPPKLRAASTRSSCLRSSPDRVKTSVQNEIHDSERRLCSIQQVLDDRPPLLRVHSSAVAELERKDAA